MIDLPWATVAAAGLIVALGYTVYGLTGFGSSMVAIPLLAHFFPLRFAVPMMLVFDLCAGVLLGLKSRQHLDRAELLRLLPFLLVGMAVGATLLASASDRWLLVVLGTFVLVYALYNLVRTGVPSPVSQRWAIPAGTLGGVFTALYGTGGPVYTMYLARRLSDKAALRATIGILIFTTAFVRLALFTGSGFYAQEGLVPLALLLIPCALGGYLLGTRLHHWLAPERVTRVVWLLLVAGGASLLWRGFATS
jgi:uncharacterized membrane protein YfcA